jgi:hypothetical protein
LDLPHQVVRLTEQVTQMAGHMQALTEAQQRTEARLEALATTVQGLSEAQQRTEMQIATLTKTVQGLSTDVATLKGHDLEVQYRPRRRYTFRRALRRLHVLSEEELDEVLHEAEEQGTLSPSENEDIALADLIVRGRLRTTGAEVSLVVEVSFGVGHYDGQWAAKRAALLGKTGRTALPAVVGEWVTPDAQQLAPGLGVWQFTPSEAVPPAS